MSTIVRTQSELDAALAIDADDIVIASPAGVWLTARGSAHVEAWESAHVVARGSAHVVARGSAHVVASSLVAVHLHSARATVEGGVLIDVTALDLTDAATWCEFHGIAVVDGVATLYKALDDQFAAGHSYQRTVYAVGTEMACADWRPNNSCGGGFHFGPTISHATAYRSDAQRWVRVEVPLDDLRPILDGTPKCKARTCRVVAEVDRWGVDMGSAS